MGSMARREGDYIRYPVAGKEDVGGAKALPSLLVALASPSVDCVAAQLLSLSQLVSSFSTSETLTNFGAHRRI
jgi:hypothetical protein